MNVRIIRLPEFRLPFRSRKIEKLTIALGTLWRAMRIFRCVDRMNPHVIVGNYVTTYGLYAKLSKRRPFILFAYGSDIVVEPHLTPLHRAITINVIKAADLVLIDCETQKRALLSLGCSDEKIVSFPWFNQDEIRNVTPDPTLRNKLGWQNNVVVVCVRAHETTYAVDTLIRAIPLVLQHAHNVRFLIFGNGTKTSKLIHLARDLKISPYVHFAGILPRDQLLRVMKNCDIYVSTSLTDGSSSSLLEAMSFGLPVVVTSIDGNAEWITQGINGVMFPTHDFEQLAKMIVDLGHNETKRERFGHAARLVVEERIDWKSSSERLVKKIRELALSRNSEVILYDG